MRRLALAVLLLAPARALAHGPAWNTEPWIVVCIAAPALAYALGMARLIAASRNSTAAVSNATCFTAGMAALVAALMSPLDTLGSELFSAHMLQHELLMLAAAPLLVLGRPLAIWVWAVKPGIRNKAARVVHSPSLARPWAALTQPLIAWTLHALVLWGWHLPVLFEAAGANEGLHALQHVSFLLSALLFWQIVLVPRARKLAPVGVLLYLFTTMLHTGALGALLTFASSVWYSSYATSAPHWGLSGLEDQQLGGLIMWIPGGAVYLVIAVVIAARWLSDSPAGTRVV